MGLTETQTAFIGVSFVRSQIRFVSGVAWSALERSGPRTLHHFPWKQGPSACLFECSSLRGSNRSWPATRGRVDTGFWSDIRRRSGGEGPPAACVAVGEVRDGGRDLLPLAHQ